MTSPLEGSVGGEADLVEGHPIYVHPKRKPCHFVIVIEMVMMSDIAANLIYLHRRDRLETQLLKLGTEVGTYTMYSIRK